MPVCCRSVSVGTENQRKALPPDRIIDRNCAPLLRVADQSLLNVWLHINGLTPTLDRSFNCQIGRGARDRGKLRAIRRARILHFNGLKLSNTQLAIRIARGCCVPYIGHELFAIMYLAMFATIASARSWRGALRLALGTRDRVAVPLQLAGPRTTLTRDFIDARRLSGPVFEADVRRRRQEPPEIVLLLSSRRRGIAPCCSKAGGLGKARGRPTCSGGPTSASRTTRSSSVVGTVSAAPRTSTAGTRSRSCRAISRRYRVFRSRRGPSPTTISHPG